MARYLFLFLALASTTSLSAVSKSLELSPSLQAGLPFSFVDWTLTYTPYDLQRNKFYGPLDPLSNSSSIGLVASVISGVTTLGPQFLVPSTTWGYSAGVISPENLYDDFRARIGARVVVLDEKELSSGNLLSRIFGATLRFSVAYHLVCEWGLYWKSGSDQLLPNYLQFSFGYSFESEPVFQSKRDPDRG